MSPDPSLGSFFLQINIDDGSTKVIVSLPCSNVDRRRTESCRISTRRILILSYWGYLHFSTHCPPRASQFPHVKALLIFFLCFATGMIFGRFRCHFGAATAARRGTVLKLVLLSHIVSLFLRMYVHSMHMSFRSCLYF